MADKDGTLVQGSSDFLATMTPGFYILSCSALIGSQFRSVPPVQTFLDQFRDPLSQDANKWLLVLGLGLSAYLLGNVTRAIGVNTADRLWGVVRWPVAYLRGWPDREAFPYRTVIAPVLKATRDTGHAVNLTLPEGEWPLHDTYNCWKIYVAEAAPKAFAVCRELEARVRLFSGMICASVLGLVVGAVGAVGHLALRLDAGWLPEALVAVLSASFFAVYGFWLRRLRRQEVRALVMAYVIARDKARPPAPPAHAPPRGGTGAASDLVLW